jgi:DNA adenine methylase
MQKSLFDLPEYESKANSSTVRRTKRVTNVASVPMRSPFRYPGGKTWLVPQIRRWLAVQGGPEKQMIELFAGGGIVSLTAVFEKLVGHATLVELDQDVAAVWQTIIQGDAEWLANQIVTFDLTPDSARKAIANRDESVQARALATIIKNRVNRGGILAEGASFVRHGENGKGILSRWYPTTLKRRIIEIHHLRDRFSFIWGDAFSVLNENLDQANTLFFIDPPYVKAGSRLYNHSEIDHLALFELVYRAKGNFLMTYDDHPEIQRFALEYGFDTRHIPMKTTHHAQKFELLIGRSLDWMERTDSHD